MLDTRTYITDVFSETYTRNPPKMASVIFAGTDKRQPQNIKSVPYWSNLRGWDITPTEGQEILSTLPPEDLKILVLVHTFINELQKDKYSYKKLCKMIHPGTKSYWKDFSAAHIAVHNLNLGFSSKVRYNETHNIAYVLLFNNFNHDGSFMINQPQYSEDIAAIYLMKDNERSAWKITSFNIEPDKMIKTITISPFKTVKKILNSLSQK